jgi:zinc/manganese transport system substrate-binding protein
MPSVRTAVVLAAIGALALTGCSDSGSSDNGAAVRSGDAAACPGDVVDVVVSVGQWGDVVGQLGGDCTAVTTIVTSSAIDPHDFEPGTADLAAFTGADVVVLNGAHYDEWAKNVVETLDDEPLVVSAAEVAGVADGEDPHLWYDPAIVEQMSGAITEALIDASPGAGPYLADRAQDWEVELQPYRGAIEKLRAVAAGRTYAATETVFDRMAAAVGLRDLTPEGYRRAVSNEGEPTPGDLADFAAVLSGGDVDVLIQNVQTEGELATSLISAAKDGGVSFVAVTESQPEAGGSFVAWQVAQLEELALIGPDR